ncbi:hypothetical protein Tco_1557098 [Tanacetum coccineum]
MDPTIKLRRESKNTCYQSQGQGPHVHLLRAVNIARLKFFIIVLLLRLLASPRLFFNPVDLCSTHIHVLGGGAQMLSFPCLNSKDPERMRRIYGDGDSLHILRGEMGKALFKAWKDDEQHQESRQDWPDRIMHQ